MSNRGQHQITHCSLRLYLHVCPNIQYSHSLSKATCFQMQLSSGEQNRCNVLIVTSGQKLKYLCWKIRNVVTKTSPKSFCMLAWTLFFYGIDVHWLLSSIKENKRTVNAVCSSTESLNSLFFYMINMVSFFFNPMSPMFGYEL